MALEWMLAEAEDFSARVCAVQSNRPCRAASVPVAQYRCV